MYKYKELKFYQRAEVLSNDVFDLTMMFPKFETYELGGQMRRASDSIVLNIAEGGTKETVKAMVSYLRHALGSVDEVEVQFGKVIHRGYITREKGERYIRELKEIGRMINGFIRKLNDRGDGVRK